MKDKKCHNCKYSGHLFKIGKMTHTHCNHHKYGKDTDPWETLREFWNTCEDHEFKEENNHSRKINRKCN